jgi:peptidoglycan/LPS O-acetylase OafA/YrhL
MGQRETSFPILDSFRLLACLGVIIAHCYDPSSAFHAIFPWGAAGVHFFFVISGFLITDILLRGRARGVPAGAFLRSFYARRSLRIFPPYYLLLLLVWIFLRGRPGLADQYPYHLAYLSNFKLWLQAPSLPLNHLWSLAVEEQFYLVWPWLILFLPERWFLPLFLTLISGASLSRVWTAVHLGQWTWNSRIVPWYCMDSLSLGGLLAYLRSSPARSRTLERWATLALAFGFPLLAYDCANSLTARAERGFFVATSTVAVALCAFWLIHWAAGRPGGWAARLLGWRPLRGLGKISYGIYLVHYVVRDWVFAALPAAGLKPHGLASVAATFLLSALIAGLSWTILEKPLLRMKARFPYPLPDAASPRPANRR